jgi:hypothetical protein
VRLSSALPLQSYIVCRSPTTPAMPKHAWFRLIPVRSPLLRESLLFSFPPGNEMFQFPGFASRRSGISRLLGMGCPIRTSADQFVFANPRGFSQLITSFFASKSQGILRTPFSTFSRLDQLTPQLTNRFWISPLRVSLKTFVSVCFFQHVKELYPYR